MYLFNSSLMCIPLSDGLRELLLSASWNFDFWILPLFPELEALDLDCCLRQLEPKDEAWCILGWPEVKVWDLWCWIWLLVLDPDKAALAFVTLGLGCCSGPLLPVGLYWGLRLLFPAAEVMESEGEDGFSDPNAFPCWLFSETSNRYFRAQGERW